MSKQNQFTIELTPGLKGIANEQRYYLPDNSVAIGSFKEPMSISVKTTVQSGQSPKHPSGAMKVFVGQDAGWQDSQAIIDVFREIWVEALQFFASLSTKTVELIYFSGQATQHELFSLWPFLPFEYGKDKRLFVSAVQKLTRTPNTPSMWLCVEYCYDDFKRLASRDGFEYTYGTTIMGISVIEAKVQTYIRKNLLDKAILEEALKDAGIRCWWFCDADFEGMTIYHKDHTGKDLFCRLQDHIKGKVADIGGQISIC